MAYDCVKLIFVRDGSAILLSEFGEKPVRPGDAVVLSAGTLCGSEPEDTITVTTLYLDRDYTVDLVFWQFAALLADRLDAKGFAEELCSEPAQIIRLGEQRAEALMPCLDELVALTLDGPDFRVFYRMQALLFAVLDVIAPLVTTSPIRETRRPPRNIHRGHLFAPVRAEARAVAGFLRQVPERRWTLTELAAAVHLSPSQLGRVFVDAYGKTPMTYLATVRAERLARLLRETDLPVETAMRKVGWHSRGHAARMFRQAVGVTPTRYRELSREFCRFAA